MLISGDSKYRVFEVNCKLFFVEVDKEIISEQERDLKFDADMVLGYDGKGTLHILKNKLNGWLH